MRVLRTPDERFRNLPDYPFDPHWTTLRSGLRMHHVDEGPPDAGLFDGADPNSVRAFFDEMMNLGVEGMMVSPGYAYPKAPDQITPKWRQ